MKGVLYMNHLHCRLLAIGALITGLISLYDFGQTTPELYFNLPQQVTGATVDENGPVLVVDAQGNIIVSWTQYSITHSSYAIYAARFDFSTSTWSSPQQISSFGAISTNPCVSPEIAMDGQGNVIVTWFVNFTAVFAARFEALAGWPNGWSTEQLLDSGIINNVRVAMDQAGNGIVVDSSDFIGVNAILFNFATMSWQTPFTISEPIFPTQPNIAFDGLGNAIAVWNNASSGTLRASRYTPGLPWPQGWTPITDIVTISNNIDHFSYPAIGTTMATQGSQTGDAIVVWQTPTDSSVQAAFYDNTLGFTTGGWQSPQTIGSALLTTFIDPTVKLDNNGNGVALWQQITSTTSSQIFSTNFDFASKSWILPASLISPITQNAEAPNLALDINGNAVATWYRLKPQPHDTIALVIQANQNKSDGTWFPAHDISLIGVNGFAPNIAINNNHQTAAAWGFPLTDLFVTNGLAFPPLITETIHLGTASAIAISAGADTIFLDFISQGIVYTYIHYPNTPADDWQLEQVSPATLFAFELDGSTDVDGNHAIVYTAAPMTTTRQPSMSSNNRTYSVDLDITPTIATICNLFTRTTTTTTTTKRLKRSLSTVTTTTNTETVFTGPVTNPICRVNPSTTTTTRQSGNWGGSLGFIAQVARYKNTTTFTTTTRRSSSQTRQAGTLIPVSPTGASFLTHTLNSDGTALAWAWLITDTIQNITRVQGNYENLLSDIEPEGYRYLSADGVDVVSTATPIVGCDSQGGFIFALVATGSDTTYEVQVTSFQVNDTSEQWTSFDPFANILTLGSLSDITALTLSFASYYAVLAWATPTTSIYFDQKSNTWTLTSPSTRVRSPQVESENPINKLLAQSNTDIRATDPQLTFTSQMRRHF